MYLDGRILGLARRHRVSLSASVVFGWLGGVITVVQAWLLAHIIAEVFILWPFGTARMPPRTISAMKLEV